MAQSPNLNPLDVLKLDPFALINAFSGSLLNSSLAWSLPKFSPALGSMSALIATNTGATSNILSGGATRDATLGLSGTVATGGQVSIYDGSTLLGKATVVGNNWSFNTANLTDGYHSLKAVIANGNSSQSFSVGATIDTVAKGSLSSTLITDTGATKTIQSGASTTDHTLGLSGTSEAGSLVKIYDGNTLLGQTLTDWNGKWSFNTAKLADGHHEFSAQFTDLVGNRLSVGGLSADLTTATAPTPAPKPAHTWSNASGWGSVDALAAINKLTGKALADVKATAGTQWGFDKANINDAWSYGYTGKGITIATIDSGLDLKNSDLTGHLSKASWNFINNSADVTDDNGHGSFVASELVAANNGVGLTGACYDADLLVLKTQDANGSGSADTICTAIRYAVDHSAKIINMSLGGGDYAGYASALQYAQDHNVLVVMSAGNSGGSSPLNPAAYAKQFSNCLAVGALKNNSDGSLSMSSFSNKAGSDTAYGFVDAAGEGVIGYTTGGGAASWSGTSMAAPLVAASAALLWCADTTASASQIAQIISQTSHNVI